MFAHYTSPFVMPKIQLVFGWPPVAFYQFTNSSICKVSFVVTTAWTSSSSVVVAAAAAVAATATPATADDIKKFIIHQRQLKQYEFCCWVVTRWLIEWSWRRLHLCLSRSLSVCLSYKIYRFWAEAKLNENTPQPASPNQIFQAINSFTRMPLHSSQFLSSSSMFFRSLKNIPPK